MTKRAYDKIFNATLIIAGLGYFVDAFDMFLYNAVRVPSLRDMGVTGDAITKTVLEILSLQLAGMFIGGYIWGVVGDKIGRKNALICTVLLYSLGSLGSAFAWSTPFYAAMRFLTGLGVAGETGLGAILVVETLPDKKRNLAIMAFAIFGVTAIFSANLIAEFVPWRMCYATGAVAGFLLLLVRRKLMESSLFKELPARTKLGSWQFLLKNNTLLRRYVCTLLFALPNFVMANFLITLAPEFTKGIGMDVPIKANVALLVFFSMQFVSDFLAVLVSMFFRSRKKAITLYMVASALVTSVYVFLNHPTETEFYLVCGAMGFVSYWVLLIFTAVEQFGTNMRGTLGVSALSTGRAMLVVVNMAFLGLRGAGLDMVTALRWEMGIIFLISFICFFGVRETYRASVDFVESAA